MNRFLGIDYGTVRIGLALSDPSGILASPLPFLENKSPQQISSALTQLAQTHQVEQLIVGLPRNMDGSYGPAAEGARAFAEQLKSRVQCPVDLWDERLTTVSAQRALRESGRKARDQRGVVDQVAAQFLLQSWLDRSACA